MSAPRAWISLTRACGLTALTRWWPAMCCSTSKTARRCSRASMSCCGRREYSFRRRTAWASGSHARVFASGGAATQGKCPMCRLTVCTRWRRPSPRLALRCWRPKTCFPRRRTSLSQQEKVNEHRSAGCGPRSSCAQTKYLLTMGTRLSSAETKKDSVPMSSVRSGTEKKALQESVLTPRN